MFTTGRQLSLILGFLLKVRLGELVRSLGPSLVTQTVKNLSAMQETEVPSLGRKDPLEKGMATHFSILAWRTPWTNETGGLQSMGVAKSQTCD